MFGFILHNTLELVFPTHFCVFTSYIGAKHIQNLFYLFVKLKVLSPHNLRQHHTVAKTRTFRRTERDIRETSILDSFRRGTKRKTDHVAKILPTTTHAKYNLITPP